MNSRLDKNLVLFFLTCLSGAACRKTSDPPIAKHTTASIATTPAAPTQPAPASAIQSSPTNPAVQPVKSTKTIHDVDVEDFVTQHYSELDPNLENLKDECAEGQDPIRSVDIQYGDVDGDGQDEALYQGFTCMSGSAGVDYSGIVKLQLNGKLVGLPIAQILDTFKGRNPFEGLRGHVRWEIEDGRFVEIYPVYKGDECEACSEGGQRKFVFRWDGHQLVLDRIVDIPPGEERKLSGANRAYIRLAAFPLGLPLILCATITSGCKKAESPATAKQSSPSPAPAMYESTAPNSLKPPPLLKASEGLSVDEEFARHAIRNADFDEPMTAVLARISVAGPRWKPCARAP
jgi:hypothetical protein